MLVVGIDPGIATTGLGFVRETANGFEIVDYGIIVTRPDLPPAYRLLELHKNLRHFLLLHQPDYGAVEKLFFSRNVTTAISVGQARGVSLLALAESGISVAEYTPKEVKQAVAGFGGAGKRQVQLMVKTLLQLKEIPRPDDAADALAIALCHLASYKMNDLTTT